MPETEEKDFFQQLTGEFLDFLAWVGDRFGDPEARDAMVKDLGGQPRTTDPPSFSQDKLDRLRAYRESSQVSAQAAIEAIADIATLLDEMASLAEAWVGAGAGAGLQQTGHALLELTASNYFRVRFPRTFLVLQSVSTLEELTSTYGGNDAVNSAIDKVPGNLGGVGNNTLVNVFDSIFSLLGYLWQPGRSLEQIAGGPDAKPGYLEAGVDVVTRLLAGLLGLLDRDEKHAITVLHDVMTGWDARGIDLDSPVRPTRADVVSARMTSFSFGADTFRPEDPSASGRVNVSTALLHEIEGGPALFLALGGSADVEQKLGDRWKFSFKARADAGVAVMLPKRVLPGGPDAGDFAFSVGYAATPPDISSADTGVSDKTFTIRIVGKTRIDIGSLAFTLSLASTTGAEALVSIGNSALVIDPADNDGFVAELLGKTPLRLPFNLVIGYSSLRGLVLEGSFGATGRPPPLSGSGNVGPPVIAATIPVGRAFGPVTIHEVGVRLTRGPADAPPGQMKQYTLELDVSFSAQIGPVYVRMDRLGIELTVDSGKPPAERNLRLIDLHAGAKFPRGIAVHVETAVVAGGGSILHDPEQGIYFGTLDLTFRGGLTMQAICLVATRLDGSKGFSLIAILTIELGNPYPLGMGFFLQGVGGMLAVHRTFDEAAMRAALPTGQLRNVLFPADPVHHTAEILRALQTLFPVRRGSHIVGILAKIGWASPTLVQFELGLLYEWGRQHRLIILGRVSAILPGPDLAILKLNMDAVGILDFDAGTFALDAMLYDSKLCDRFVITGAMAMRMGWKGSAGFALAVGGLHPRFAAPAGFPSVARLQLALTNGDNPKLICRAYFAITSNTVQFGANASLYAAAYGFSIQGHVGFDVLIQLVPFHFLAEFRASVQLKRGSHNLFKVSVAGELEGPLPLRVAGKASFEILWCDFSVKFNVTLADGGTPNDLILVDVLGVLIAALSEPRSWQAQLPGGASQLVGLRQPVTNGVLLHPLGTLTVRQSVVPLGLTRDIDRVGSGTPGADRRFTVTGTSIGPKPQARTSVRELFAPGQFFDMSDDDRLAAPSFESMDAGVTFGDGGYSAGPGKPSPFEYTNILIGPDGNPVLQPDPFRQDGASVLIMTMLSAAGASRVRRTLDRRFAAPVSPAAPTLNPGGWVAVAAGASAPVDAKLTWAEARGQAVDRSAFVLVPRSEVVGA